MGNVALGLAAAAVAGLVMVLWGMVWDANVGAAELLRAAPPARLINGRPDAVLLASRRAGITVLLSIGPLWALSMLGFGAVVALTGGFVAGAGTVLVLTLFLSGLNALVSGLDAWLYHYWVRWRLARAGLLPVRLPEFFDWCAASQRRWIRVTDAYEFRHRELLEHLAGSGGSSR